MKLLSIELYLYKPLMHNGVKHLVVDDMSTITVVAGENGSGKSSLLRECTPYPACRTDYEKGGYKKVVYFHHQEVYTLTSDFRKPNGAHSFLKGEVELNNSGTTEVQEELAISTFGLTDTVRKLVSGKYKICDMGKPERKSLIMSTYPSSMTFILEHYKAISSRLRAAGNNIKMLAQREQSLKAQMMPETILTEYIQQRDDLNRGVTAIDMDVYAIRKAVENAAVKLGDDDLESLEQEKARIQSLMQTYILTYRQLTSGSIVIPNAGNVKDILRDLSSEIRSLQQQVSTMTDSAYEMKDEIAKYKDYLNNDTKENLKECERLIALQDDIIQHTDVDARYPVIPEDELTYLEKAVPEWAERIQQLAHQVQEGKWKMIPTEQEIISVERRIDSLREKQENARGRYLDCCNDLKRMEARLESQKKYTWPPTCAAMCMLRSSMQAILSQITEDIRMTTALQEEAKGIVDQTEREINDAISYLEDVRPEREIMTYLERCILPHTWRDFLLNGRTLTEAFNENPVQLRNTLLKIVDNGRKALQVKLAKDMKTILEAKKAGLENSAAPAENLIKESLVKTEAKLESITREIQTTTYTVNARSESFETYSKYSELVRDVQELLTEYNTWKLKYRLVKEIAFFESVIRKLLDSRETIQNKLRELDAIIKDQESFRIRLEQEVRPELEKLRIQHHELAILETQLNPTRGIPHLYTTRYINSILSLTNKFIARVWSYPMEIQYIPDDNEAFDYSFPLVLNGSSSIKDINMASAGQQAIINLCFTLAICIFRQYTLEYPLILDEVTVNLSIQHQNNLVLFINELLAQNDQILQVLIVDHCIDVCSSFTSIAEMVCLSPGMELDAEWKCIGMTE